MTTALEKRLARTGYKFSGVFTTDRLEATDCAKRFRLNNHYARVARRVYVGKVSSVTGYSVYIKERQAAR